MKRRLRDHPGEQGYVLALLAISLVALMLMIGFAVDLGTWYLRATKLQRAADVAALSAAGSLPDTATARQVADDTLAHNGFTNSTRIQTTVTVSSSNVKVVVHDNAVPTYFLRVLFPSISMSRAANAMHASAIPLGNPFNVFGIGAPEGLNLNAVPLQGFFASINGPCDSQEDGDYFSAKWDHNKINGSHVCSGPILASYPATHTGYNYEVDVPAGAGATNIEVWDGPSSTGESGAFDQDSPDENGNTGGMDTNYSVYDLATGAVVGTPENFWDGDPTPAQCWACWQVLAPNVAPGKYRVNVSSLSSTEGDGDGNGNQGLMYNDYTIGAFSTTAPLKVCSSITDAGTCPRVSGMGAVSVYMNVTNSNAADFYMAAIDPGFAGSTLQLYLWDPGEGMKSIQLLDPTGTPVKFTCTVAPVVPCNTGANSDTLDVSQDPAPQPPGGGLDGTGEFNDRLVTLTFTVPSYTLPADGNNWFKLRYTSGSGTVHDTITYGVSASGESPTHLTNVPVAP